jgi:hypothetical protein
LISNCDEFIYYDDLVASRAQAAKKISRRRAKEKKEKALRPEDAPENGAEDPPKQKALEMLLETVDALFHERDDNLWGSMVKQTLKRKRPNFNESFHGYRNFNQLLEDAHRRGLLEIEKDERSGGYLVLSFGKNA